MAYLEPANMPEYSCLKSTKYQSMSGFSLIQLTKISTDSFQLFSGYNLQLVDHSSHKIAHKTLAVITKWLLGTLGLHFYKLQGRRSFTPGSRKVRHGQTRRKKLGMG